MFQTKDQLVEFHNRLCETAKTVGNANPKLRVKNIIRERLDEKANWSETLTCEFLTKLEVSENIDHEDIDKARDQGIFDTWVTTILKQIEFYEGSFATAKYIENNDFKFCLDRTVRLPDSYPSE